MTMHFEIKKNRSVFWAVLLAILFCGANFALTMTNFGAYRDRIKLVSRVARKTGTFKITDEFKKNYYEIVVVPELKQIQRETGRSIDSLTGIKENTLKYDGYKDVMAAVMEITVSPSFFDMEKSEKTLAERVASVLSDFDSKIYKQSEKDYFPDDGSTGFAAGYAVLKGAVFTECSVLTVLVFALCALGEKRADGDAFGVLFSTARGKKVFNWKILEAFVFSFGSSLIVISGTSIVHLCYFDYAPYVNASIDGPYFFAGIEAPPLMIPGMTFLQYYFATVLFMILSLSFIFCVLGSVFVLTRSGPIYVFIAAAVLAAAFMLSGWIGAQHAETHIKEVFPFPYFVAGNSFLLKSASGRSEEIIIVTVFAAYVAASAAALTVCLYKAKVRKR